MKVLLSSYSCLPDAGSEPGIGWNWAQSLGALGHDVVVMTRAVNREAIERHYKGRSASVRFLFHDLPKFWRRMYRLPFGNYLYYLCWQFTAVAPAARMHAREGFDRIQHITWGSFRVPCFLGKLNAPFIFGPVGGGEDTPKLLRPGLGLRGRFWDFVRRLSNAAAIWIPYLRPTYAAATEILVTTGETRNRVPAAWRHKTAIRPAIGIDAASVRSVIGRAASMPEPRNRDRIDVLYCGRLLPWKGLHLALEAMAVLQGNDCEARLTVIGSGSDERRLKRLARHLHIDGRVAWIPWMPREDLIRVYSAFDIFLFPSLHDSGGIAVLEALVCGLPVVCLDLGGPAITVNDSCGRVISTAEADQAQVVAAIAGFLMEAKRSPDLLARLSQGALRRGRELDWCAGVSAVYGGAAVTQAR